MSKYDVGIRISVMVTVDADTEDEACEAAFEHCEYELGLFNDAVDEMDVGLVRRVKENAG